MENVEQLLMAKRLETFTVSGTSHNVILADQMAWRALEAVLGTDPVQAWTLKVMAHNYAAVEDESNPEGPPKAAVSWQAEFVRNPDYDPEFEREAEV